MEQEIGALVHKMRRVILRGGFAKFVRFLKNLAGDGLSSAGIETGDVTFWGRIFNPILNDLIEFVYDVFHTVKDKQKPERKTPSLRSLPQKFKVQNRLIVFQLSARGIRRNRIDKSRDKVIGMEIAVRLHVLR